MSSELVETLRRAIAAYGRGAWDDAEALCRDVLGAKADQADALNLLGMIAAQTQRPLEAEALFGRAVAANPGNAWLRVHHGVVLQQLGRLDAALSCYAQAIALAPGLAEAHNHRGSALQQQGRLAAALESYATAIRHKPDAADAHYNRGSALHGLGRHDEALASYAEAIRLQPDFAMAWINQGNALQALGRHAEALASFDRAVQIEPGSAEAHYNRGGALQALGRLDEAVRSYDAALARRPGYAEACNNRGTALHALNRIGEALESYDHALGFRPDYVEALANRANALQHLRRPDEALASCDRALALRPDYAEALLSRGNALQALGRVDDALDSYDRALKLSPAHAVAWNNRGTALQRLGQPNEALASFDRALELDPNYAPAWNNRGNVLQEAKRLDEALASYARALAIDPDREYCLGSWLHTKMKLCDWNGVEGDVARLFARIERGEKATMPFPVLALTDSPVLQRRAAQIWIDNDQPPGAALPPIAPRAPQGKVRIGYYSADFHNHATAHLVAELFELHDRTRFEVVAFSFGPDRDDEFRRRIRVAADRFVDVRRATDREVAARSRELGIDIAVDLKGLTQDNRLGIFALRAAPVQAGYLGYPGTCGADYIDYLIADRCVIPEDSRQHYTEKIAWLPDSYQVNDRRRAVADVTFPRVELGLPPTGFVFCSFNNGYKIMPEVFDGWMRIVGQVEGSVLWLLEDNPTAAANLRREALARGVGADRLVFAPRLSAAEHLARHRAADLFLDTFPCNAHTTASDALWAGLPLLTRAGESFAARVAASLLGAIGLPELVTTSQAQYEALAVALANEPQRLARIRETLARNRNSAPLFDSRLFATRIEDAFLQMHARHEAGQAPDDIIVGF